MTCPWCGRPVTACPDPTGHDLADRASETTWRRIAESDQDTRRDYQPGTGPSAGLVWGLLAVAPVWCLAALAVRWWWW